MQVCEDSPPTLPSISEIFSVAHLSSGRKLHQGHGDFLTQVPIRKPPGRTTTLRGKYKDHVARPHRYRP